MEENNESTQFEQRSYNLVDSIVSHTIMLLLWTILLVFTSLSNGLDETVLWKIPKPMKGFQWQQHFGRWYNQFRKAPCSWSGALEFTDNELFFGPETKQSILFSLTMRNRGICNTITSRAFLQSPEAITKAEDTIAGGFGGLYVQVAGDPKLFGIAYGCTKLNVLGDKCDDPSITIRTRMRFPDKRVIAMIHDALMQLWGIGVDELHRVQHIQPCFQQQPVGKLNKQWW
ncbi:hypothetical protein ACF0H5_009583 [Mactra antiquata]